MEKKKREKMFRYKLSLPNKLPILDYNIAQTLKFKGAYIEPSKEMVLVVPSRQNQTIQELLTREIPGIVMEKLDPFWEYIVLLCGDTRILQEVDTSLGELPFSVKKTDAQPTSNKQQINWLITLRMDSTEEKLKDHETQLVQTLSVLESVHLSGGSMLPFF